MCSCAPHPPEREQFAVAIALAADACECWLRDGIEAAMNAFNATESMGATGMVGPNGEVRR